MRGEEHSCSRLDTGPLDQQTLHNGADENSGKSHAEVLAAQADCERLTPDKLPRPDD